MPPKNPRLAIKKNNNIVVVRFVDRNIVDEKSIQQIGEELDEIIEASKKPKVLISFKKVEHLSSAALGVLITVNDKIKKKKGHLRLSNIDPQIKKVFTITSLDKLFKIYDDDNEALENLQLSAWLR